MMYDLPPELEVLFFRMTVVIGGKSALRWQTNMVADKPFLSAFVINFTDGIRHRVFLVPRLTLPDLRGILLGVDSVCDQLAKIEMQCAKHLDLDTPSESSDDLPISNRIFFFTDELQASREKFREVLHSTREVVAIIDDEEWKRRLDMRRCGELQSSAARIAIIGQSCSRLLQRTSDPQPTLIATGRINIASGIAIIANVPTLSATQTAV